MEGNIYAIISSGGKQYKVEEDKDIVVEKIDGEEGEKVTLSDVNMVSDGGKVRIGKTDRRTWEGLKLGQELCYTVED